MTRLTANAKKTLAAAQKQELRRALNDGPGAAPWPAPWQTLYSLVNRGFLQDGVRKNRTGKAVRIWTITDAGRQALQPTERFMTDRPLYLADRRSATHDWRNPNSEERHDEDYTTDPSRRIDTLEVVDADRLHLVWTRRSEANQMASKDRQDIGRQLAHELRVA